MVPNSLDHPLNHFLRTKFYKKFNGKVLLNGYFFLCLFTHTKLIFRNNIDERMAHRNKTSDKASSEALNEALNEAINADEKIIVKHITGVPSINQEEISKKSGFSRSMVQRIMKKLSDSHVIYREGAKKDGFWRVGVQ